jgi:hypothetical protein
MLLLELDSALEIESSIDPELQKLLKHYKVKQNRVIAYHAENRLLTYQEIADAFGMDPFNVRNIIHKKNSKQEYKERITNLEKAIKELKALI